MTRRFINQLTDGETIEEVFLANEKQLRRNRAGNPYIQLRLSDRTGSVVAMLWNASQGEFENIENGDYVRVKGNAQLFNGTMQIIAKGFSSVPTAQIDPADFETLSKANIDQLAQHATHMLRGMKNVHLRNLAETFILDDELMAKLQMAPAGVKNHHAYQGGLLQHIVSLMELAQKVSGHYQNVDDDLLLLGSFLHDLGKIEELTYQRDLGYSDEGQLIGHIVIGVRILDQKIAETEKMSGEPVPEELVFRLRHMIVSHHGEYQFGSPKLPMTPEAVALRYIDILDARLHAIDQLIEDDLNEESAWTNYVPALDRKFYKGSID